LDVKGKVERSLGRNDLINTLSQRKKLMAISRSLELSPKKALKSLKFIETSIDINDNFIRGLSCYILYKLSFQGYREEVKKFTPRVIMILNSISDDIAEARSLRIKCRKCYNVNEVDSANIPKRMKCSKCGKVGFTSGNPMEEGLMDVPLILWSVSFLYEMSRYGDPLEIKPALPKLKEFKNHDFDLLRKRSKLTRKHVLERIIE
jgi:hypothetical protein